MLSSVVSLFNVVIWLSSIWDYVPQLNFKSRSSDGTCIIDSDGHVEFWKGTRNHKLK